MGPHPQNHLHISQTPPTNKAHDQSAMLLSLSASVSLSLSLCVSVILRLAWPGATSDRSPFPPSCASLGALAWTLDNNIPATHVHFLAGQNAHPIAVAL